MTTQREPHQILDPIEYSRIQIGYSPPQIFPIRSRAHQSGAQLNDSYIAFILFSQNKNFVFPKHNDLKQGNMTLFLLQITINILL